MYDIIEPLSTQIRPNQVITLGLDFSPVSKEKAIEILELIEKELYTNKGLKTLASTDKEYKSYYFDLDLQHNQEQSHTQFFKFILNNSWFAIFMGIKTIKLFFKQLYS